MKVIKAVQTKGYGYGIYSGHSVGTECFQNIRLLVGEVAEMIVSLIRVQEVPGSNVCRATVYLASGFLSLSSADPDKYRDTVRNWTQVACFSTPLNSLFTCRPAFRR
jgi:hypothetical protein